MIFSCFFILVICLCTVVGNGIDNRIDSGRKYVFNTFCHSEGIGAWLQRCILPYVVQHYCPMFEPLWKECDFVGHNGTSFKQLFNAVVVDERSIDRLMQRRRLIRLSQLDLDLPWKPQFDALNCTLLAAAGDAIVFDKKPRAFMFQHEFNSMITFSLPPELSLKLSMNSHDRCIMRVVFHYRAGDLYNGLHAEHDDRSIRTTYLKALATRLRTVFESQNVSYQIHIITELSLDEAVELSEMLRANVLFESNDVVSHIALAAIADVLVLSWSSFSWLISLFNSNALKIVPSRGAYWARYKFKSSSNTVTDVDRMLSERVIAAIKNKQNIDQRCAVL